MRVEVVEEPIRALEESRVPTAFEVTAIFDVADSGDSPGD